jgi:Ca2+-binding EF-hand superfamily protein
LFSKEKLKIAFEFFDVDGGGTISVDEFKDVLFAG